MLFRSVATPTRALENCRRDATGPQFRHVRSCLVGSSGDPRVLVWGDSHASMLAPAAEWTATAAQRTALVLGNPSCPPLLGLDVEYFVVRTCAENNRDIVRWLNAPSSSIGGVLLPARWPYYSGLPTPAGGAPSWL